MSNRNKTAERRKSPLHTPSNIEPQGVKEITGALNALLADVFALYLKTNNFHWHMSGPHFRDYHLLLDEQATQIFAIGDDISERVRKIGGTTIRLLLPLRLLHPLPAYHRGFARAATNVCDYLS